jgi:DNA-binding protein HU-beta
MCTGKNARDAKNLSKTQVFCDLVLYIKPVYPYDCNDSLFRRCVRRPCKYRVPEHSAGLAFKHSVTGERMATQRMTQTALVRALAAAGEVTNKQARTIIETLGSLAVSEVKKNGVFVVPGIGRLVRQDRKARMGRNPATGEAIKIPAKKVVKFRVAKACKDSIVPPKAKK